MGIYAYAVLQDAVHGLMDAIDCIDLEMSIKKALQQGILTPDQLKLVSMSAQGYTLVELQGQYPNARSLLTSAYRVIASVSGYNDGVFLSKHQTIAPRIAIVQQAVLGKMAYYLENLDELN